MEKIFHWLLTFNATSWIIVIYGIKEEWSIWKIPSCIFAVVLLAVPIITTILSILITTFLSSDSLSEGNIELANNDFLPVYLGYFFIGLGVDDSVTMFFVYIIIFVFTYISRAQYFNPILILLGYNFYYVKTKGESQIFIISKEKIKQSSNIGFENLKRINDSTFISKKGKKK